MRRSRPIPHIWCCRTCLSRRTPKTKRYVKRAQRRAERRALKPSEDD